MAHSSQPETNELTGSRVRIIRRYNANLEDRSSPVEGTVLGKEKVRTESSYRGGRGGRHWVERLVLQKDDGEVTKIVLDQRTEIEKLS